VAWIGTTLYANRFDTDDVGYRLLTGVQMLTVAALAVNVHHALGESSIGFALSYPAGRAVLVFEYLRVASYIAPARRLATRFASGFALAKRVADVRRHPLAGVSICTYSVAFRFLGVGASGRLRYANNRKTVAGRTSPPHRALT
jgi:hypothetical protein